MLAILTTHPIQYQVPIWRGLAARGDVPFKVFYLSDQGLKSSFDLPQADVDIVDPSRQPSLHRLHVLQDDLQGDFLRGCHRSGW